MRAVHLEAGSVSVREIPAPPLPEGFARLRLRLAGICNTDLELLRGYYGFTGIPGHEFVADVVEASEPAWVGRRVVGEINLACNACEWCARAMQRHCPNRTVLGIVKHPGAFAEEFTLPVSNLHEVPWFVEDRHAVFTEPLAAAFAILEQVAVPKSTPVAVLGDGKLGLLIAMTMQLHGAATEIYGRHPEKMAVASKLGVIAHPAGEPGARKFPVVVDASGSDEGLRTAIAMSLPRGTVVMKSTVARPLLIDMASVIVPEISLVGSRCGRFSDALPVISSGVLPLDDLIDAEFLLAEAPSAFARAATKGARKVLLRP